jgi:hypothetical protein
MDALVSRQSYHPIPYAPQLRNKLSEFSNIHSYGVVRRLDLRPQLGSLFDERSDFLLDLYNSLA